MSRKELTLMRRGFALGYRAGLNKAQAVMCSKVAQWEAEIGSLQTQYEMLVGELRCVRDARAIEEALVERTTHLWLN